MTEAQDRAPLFDDWAETYDDDLAGWGDAFPFGDRSRVLDRVTRFVLAGRPRAVADLGCGTGAVLARLAAIDPTLDLWGVDFAPEMLTRARGAVPAARFLRADLGGDPAAWGLPALDAAAAAYALHELPEARKVAVVAALLRGPVRPGGVVVVGDVGFPDRAALEAARSALLHWDDSEHYWVADEVVSALAAAGIAARWEQVGPHAGVLEARLAPNAPAGTGRAP